jgi:hypothetical protein
MFKALFLLSSVLTLMGCSVSQGNYSPYNNDYVYSVGYYGYQPYYGQRYYSGYVGDNNYWYGYRNANAYRGWYERRW